MWPPRVHLSGFGGWVERGGWGARGACGAGKRGAPGVDLDDLATSRTEESKVPSGHAVLGGQHKLSA